MLRFLIKRIVATIPVTCIVAVGVFLLLRLTPGDPAAIIAGDAASPESIEKIRVAMGLSEPLPVQFMLWARHVLVGDLGQSYYYKAQVSDLIAHRLEPTLALSLLTIVFAVLVAVPLGVVAAWRQGGLLDRALMGFSVLGFSIPVFVLGYALIWLLSLKLGWLPVQGYRRLAEGFGPFLYHLILPAFTLSIVYIALIARVTRASVQEVLAQDHVRTARAKGLRENLVIYKHALRNAIIPLVTLIALDLPSLFGGALFTETIFAWPGIGRLYFTAALKTDYPLVMAVLMIESALIIGSSLLVDFLYATLDPRIRLS